MEIIEEFMLLDNKRVSMKASLTPEGKQTKNPFIYRTHDNPKKEKITELLEFLGKLDYHPDLNGDGMLSTFEINRAIQEHKGKPEESIVSISILRSMEKAKYTLNATGHFGLGFKYYTHFTSPIRRYPDFIAHRLLRYYLKNAHVPAKELKKLKEDALHSSEMEVRAVEAERASIAFKYAQYYSVRIGEEFNGFISGIQRFGIFVENKKTKAQGMIPIRELPEDV
jgi:ribonuclease R